MITEQQIREALQQVPFPGLSRDIVSFGLVRDISIDGGIVTVRITQAWKHSLEGELIGEPSAPRRRTGPVHLPVIGAGDA